jgi:hypothetical protein
MAYRRQEESNMYMQPGGKNSRPEYVFRYVNASSHYYHESGKNAIPKVRIRAFNDIQQMPCSFEEFKERHCSLHKALQRFPDPNNRNLLRMKCDCSYLWSDKGHCSHIVDVYHRIGIINIIDMMS